MTQIAWHSREQQKLHDFIEVANKLESIVQNKVNDHLTEVLCGLRNAVAHFGKCDMLIRQAERYSAVKVNASESKSLTKRGLSYNMKGLHSLELTIESIQAFGKKPDEYMHVNISYQDGDVAYLKEEMPYQLAQLDIKGPDATKLNEKFQEALKAVVDGQVQGLAEFITKHISELITLRKSDDRGIRENIAYWKIVAIAAFFAICLWDLMKCRFNWFSWKCTWNEELIYYLIAIAAAVGYYLC